MTYQSNNNDQIINAIRREIQHGKDKRAKEDFQRILRMGFSAEEAYTLLAILYSIVKQKIPSLKLDRMFFDNIARQLKNGDLDKKILSAFLVGQTPQEEKDGLLKLAEHYQDDNEKSREEGVSLYYKNKDGLKSLLKRHRQFNHSDIHMQWIGNTPIVKMIQGILTDLICTNREKELKEAVQLSKYMTDNYSFSMKDEYSRSFYEALMYLRSEAYERMNDYTAAEAVFRQLESMPVDQHYLHYNRIQMLMGSPYQEDRKRAESYADKVLQNPEIQEGKYRKELLGEMAQLYSELNEQKKLEMVLDLLYPDRAEKKAAEMESEEDLSKNIFSYAIDEALNGRQFPELENAGEYLSSLGYDEDQVQTILGWRLMAACLTGTSSAKPAQKDYLDILAGVKNEKKEVFHEILKITGEL